jgi:hypothetical protein
VQITTTPQNQTEECIGVVNDIGIPATLQRAYNSAGQYFNGTSWVAYGSAWAINDVIGIAIDVTNSEITFYKNNVSQGAKTFAWNANGNCTLRLGSTTGTTYQANFGQRPFTYTPPSGFVALNTYNLSTPTIPNGAVYMAATTYTGTGASLTVANTVNGTSFQPDLVWVKGRSGATDHAWYDAVRGVQKQLESNNINTETTETTGLTAFGSTGFTVGALAQMNTSAATYVAWQWSAGGSTVTNTSGSISAQVRANTTAGFSVVTYTGTGANATIGHGLGVAPSLVIVKSNSGNTSGWNVRHISIPPANYIFLETTGATGTDATVWNSTAPTSSVFSIGTNGNINVSASTYVAYCFAPIAGYSAFGSYTGNGSTDGPFVFLGFRPRWIMAKRTDTTDNWIVTDTARNTYNVVNELLKPNIINITSIYFI